MGGDGCGGQNKTHDCTSGYRKLDSFEFSQCIPIMTQKGMKEFEHTLHWQGGSSIGIILYPDRLAVGYSATLEGEREKIYEAFHFDAVSNNYSGQRYYFLCPSCGRRCRFLYFHQLHFKCRQCAQLNYRSQQVTKGPNEAAHRLNRFLQEKLGFDRQLSPFELGQVLPERPKGMHGKTYLQRLQRWDELNSQYERAFVDHAFRTDPSLWQAFLR